MSSNRGPIKSRAWAAEYSDLSVRTWARNDKKGLGPPVVRLPNRRVGYYLADIEAWMNRRAAIDAPVLNLSVHPVLGSSDERASLWALIGASHPLLPVAKDASAERGLAALQRALLNSLRTGRPVAEEALTQAADLVMATARKTYPALPLWRGGLGVPVGWGLIHIASRLHVAAARELSHQAMRMRHAAAEASRLCELIDVAEGGRITHGLDPGAPPPLPSPAEIDDAWTRFEQAMKDITGACGTILVLEPAQPDHFSRTRAEHFDAA